MCIAIYKPEGVTLLSDTLKNSWDSNSDGAGFMYAEEGKVHIVKGLMTFDDFLAAYEPHKEKQAVLHFRISTHGSINKENTHPFPISDTLGVVHNGIITNIRCDIDKDMSDTWHFVQKILKPYRNHWQIPAFQALAEVFIGASKLIFLNGEGEFAIYNEQMGSWKDGCWFSNNSWQHKTYNVIPKRGSSWQKDGVEVGDFRRTTWEEKTVATNSIIPKGTLVEVEAFGQGAFVWTKVVEIGSPFHGCRCKISTWGLGEKEAAPLLLSSSSPFSVGEEVVFAQNYNHFRIGDKGKIASVTHRSVTLIDPLITSNKTYLVPNSVIRSAAILMH